MQRLVTHLTGALLRPVQFLVYFLSGCFPRDANTWAFGTWSGMRFADNAAAVFSHLNAHPRKGLRTVWITRRREIRDQLRSQGMRAHTTWSPAGIWWGLRSGVYVYDSIPRDLNFWLSRRAHLVLLRHGIGMKKIERAIDAPDHRLYKLFHGSPIDKLIWRVALPWHLPIPDLVMACSPEHAEQALEYFGVEPDRVRITGFPRHDRLADLPDASPDLIPTVGPKIPAGRPVYLYLPTFREGIRKQTFDWSALSEAAEAAGVTIAIKLHMVDAERGVHGLTEVSHAPNLRLVVPEVDPIEIYPHADGLITDFSSVAYDLLLLERPVVHYVPDLEDFIEHRPLRSTIEEMAVGPVCRTSAELALALHTTHELRATASDARRLELRERFYSFAPGGASERVVEAIDGLLSETDVSSHVRPV